MRYWQHLGVGLLILQRPDSHRPKVKQSCWKSSSCNNSYCIQGNKHQSVYLLPVRTGKGLKSHKENNNTNAKGWMLARVYNMTNLVAFSGLGCICIISPDTRCSKTFDTNPTTSIFCSEASATDALASKKSPPKTANYSPTPKTVVSVKVLSSKDEKRLLALIAGNRLSLLKIGLNTNSKIAWEG